MKGIKLKRSLLCFAVVFCIIFSLCGCEKNNAEDKETTAETTLQTLRYSEEELEAMAKNMPEIVFVSAYQVDDENIFGCYVTKKGKVKLYDFRKIAPDEIYDVRDVYDRLEEAEISEIKPYTVQPDIDSVQASDLYSATEEDMVDYYKNLLQINGSFFMTGIGILDWERNKYNSMECYGIRLNTSGDIEFILLKKYIQGFMSYYDNRYSNQLADELNYMMWELYNYAFENKNVWSEIYTDSENIKK